MRIRTRRIVIQAALIILVLISIEFCARPLVPVPFSPANRERLFFTPAYQAEYQRIRADWDWVDDYFVPRDMTGQWINMRGGFRVTTGQPATWRRTVWLFGNSTLVSAEVADNETIASRLQALWPDIRVINVGMDGVTIVNEVARLKTISLAAGDIVVFYDGLMDADAIYFNLPGICQPAVWFALALVCNGLYDNPAWMTPQVNQTVERVRAAASAARAYVTAAHAQFVHVLQPPGRDYARLYAHVYPALHAVVDVDLSPLAAELAPAHVDRNHVDAAGNARIARALGEALAAAVVR